MSSSSFNWRGLEGSPKIDEYLNGLPVLEQDIVDFQPNNNGEEFRPSDKMTIELKGEGTSSSVFGQGYKMINAVANRFFWMRLGLFSISMTLLFIFSVTFYVLLYQWAVPKYLHSIPVFFDHTGEHPRANVSISSLLRLNQKYSFLLQLYVPDSPTNTQIGNFMVDFSLFNAKNASIFHSRKPVSSRTTNSMFLEHCAICL